MGEVYEIKYDGRPGFACKLPDSSELRVPAEIKDEDDFSHCSNIYKLIFDAGADLPEFAELLENMLDAYSDENYSNVRDILGSLIGKTIVDITQHDEDEVENGVVPYFYIQFDDCSTLKIHVHEAGFEIFKGDTGNTLTFGVYDPYADDDFLDEDDD